jgi:hypothetical protein
MMKIIVSAILLFLPVTLLAQTFKVTPAGNFVVNDTLIIPAYVVSTEDATSETGELMTPDLSQKNMTAQAEISPEMASQLSVYWTCDGWVLVPRGWQLVRAAVGADNSSVYEFREPNNGAGVVSLYDSGGACVGCALSLAAPYFPDAKKEADDMFGQSASGLEAQLHAVKLGKHTVAYSRKNAKGQSVDGLAYYQAGDDYEAFTFEVSLPQVQHALATAILNWRLPPKDER